MDLTGRLIPPKKVGEIPQKAPWLSGEGGGAWFFIQKEIKQYRIKRFTPQGTMDCNRLFTLQGHEIFNDLVEFQMKHISHCALVRVEQNGKCFLFEYFEK